MIDWYYAVLVPAEMPGPDQYTDQQPFADLQRALGCCLQKSLPKAIRLTAVGLSGPTGSASSVITS